MNQTTLITGGQRSGKSSYAQTMAESLSNQPVYLATARHWDEDFTQRIKRHQADRDNRWQTVETDRYLSDINMSGAVVLVDCITLWLTNIFHDLNYDVDAALEEAKNEWSRFVAMNNRLIVVTNELGMGIHATNEVSRKFTDLQGWTNQFIAKNAEEVILMVSGIPMKVK